MTAVVPYILRVDMTDSAGNTAYAEYSNFVLGGTDTNYTILSLGNYSGTAGTRVFNAKRVNKYAQSQSVNIEVKLRLGV